MATTTIQTCDVCGAVASNIATIAMDGSATEIDLCARHAKAFASATKAYTSVGRTAPSASAVVKKRTASGTPTGKKATAKKSAGKATKKAAPRKRAGRSSRAAEIRAWGYANGFNVSSHGRLSPALVEAFEASDK